MSDARKLEEAGDGGEDASAPLQQNESSSEGFQHIMKAVGALGRWQWKLFIVTSSCGIVTAFHNLAAVFLAATPDHWCHVVPLDSLDISHDHRNGSVPWEGGSDGQGEFSSCLYYDRNWTGLVSGGLQEDELPLLPIDGVPTLACQEWEYDHSIYETTAVEEWNLVCSNKYQMSLIQSTYMAGVLAGALVLSELSDKFGRRTISLISSLGFIISSITIAFVNHYSLFLIFRFLVAAFGSGIFLPNFVILMETVGPEGRTIMGMLYQCFFAVGFMLLPVIAYFVNEWRSLELCISVPSVLLLLYYWFLPESPRWLMMSGRFKEALTILEGVAKTNRRTMPPQDELDKIINSIEKERKGNSKETKSNLLQKFINFFRSIITLLSTKNMRRRCLIIFFAWFVVSMVYYGLTFSGGNINASPYLLVFLSGLVEIPSYFLVCWTLKKFGRRINLCVLFIICGAACLFILAVPKDMVWVNTTLATVGKFFNSAAFAVSYIYSAELVPTGVRNIAVGTSSVCARIGSAIAPFIVDLLGELHYAVPSTVFGLLSITAGLLALLLPETGHSNLPETVEEVEQLPR